MPLYPVVNKKTGEEKELVLSVAEYEKWREENPDWDRDWVKGVASTRNFARNPEDYSSDAVCDDFAYDDKNDSLSSSRFMTKDGQIHGKRFTAPPPPPKSGGHDPWVRPNRTPTRQQGDSVK